MSMPKPGDGGPPQAGDVSHEQCITTPQNIQKFFDPKTYRGAQSVREAVHHEVIPMIRHTTPQNIRTFFNPDTYRAQKRPPAEQLEVHPAAKARMTRESLLEKFRLAASLHGYELGELIVAWRQKTL